MRSAKSAEGMARWHDDHAKAFEGDDPEMVRWRKFHEDTAAELRQSVASEPARNAPESVGNVGNSAE